MALTPNTSSAEAHFNKPRTTEQKTKDYFSWINQETEIIKVWEEWRIWKWKRPLFWKHTKEVNAHIDYYWYLQDPDKRFESEQKNEAIEVAEIRTLNKSKSDLNEIIIPIDKLNDLMKFWRLFHCKRYHTHIIWKLRDWYYSLDWDYYVRNNFQLTKKHDYLIIPSINLLLIKKIWNRRR